MIVSVGLDGTDRKEIITTDLVWPNGVAVDQVNPQIYRYNNGYIITQILNQILVFTNKVKHAWG